MIMDNDKKKKKVTNNKTNYLFKTDVVVTEKEFKKFQKFYLNKFKNSFIPKLILIALTIVAIIINLLKGNFYLVSLIIIFVIIYVIAFVLTIDRQIKKMYQKNIKINMLKETITFFEDHFESKSKYNYCQLKYDDIFKICETKSNFYIFTSKREAFIIIKDELEDVDDFRSFMMKRANYKRYH